MRKLQILLLLVFNILHLKAQDWEWVIEGEGIENLQTASDEEGNLFASGNFNGSCKLGNTTITSYKKTACFVLRYNENGKILWWKTIGSTDTLQMVELKAKAGVAYIGGNFTGTLKSGLGNYPSAGGMDIFLASFDKDGVLKRVKRDGGLEREELVSIAIGKQAIFVAGHFLPGGRLSNYTFNSSSKYSNVFFGKYDANGNFLWANELSGDSSSVARVEAIRIDSGENIYLLSIFAGIFLNGGIDNSPVSQSVLKFDSNNHELNYFQVSSGWKHRRVLMEFDKDDNLYLFEQGSDSNHSFTFANIKKCDSSGKILWEQRIGGGGVYHGKLGGVAPLGLNISNGKVFLLASYGRDDGYISLPEDNFISGFGILNYCFSMEGNYEYYIPNPAKDWNNYQGSTDSHSVTAITETAIFISSEIQKAMEFGTMEVNKENKKTQLLGKLNTSKPFPPPSFELNEEKLIAKPNEEIKISGEGKLISYYKWVFPGSIISGPPFNPEIYLKEPTVSYDSAGVYSVYVIIANHSGIKDSIFFKDLIHIEENGNQDLSSQVFNEKFLFTLHPNPASSHFTLSFKAEKADVTVTDFLGKFMFSRQVLNGENISTSGFSKGIYFVQVRVGDDVIRRKLVIN
jgi:hypothetical protein